MTIEEFTIQLEALVIKAQAAGISAEQEMAVLKGVLDVLSDGRVPMPICPLPGSGSSAEIAGLWENRYSVRRHGGNSL
jgi:hypothetical protein